MTVTPATDMPPITDKEIEDIERHCASYLAAAFLPFIARIRADGEKIAALDHECSASMVEIDRLRAELAEAREVLRECADDLAAELANRYAGTLDYPSMARKFENDMAPVRRARAFYERSKP